MDLKLFFDVTIVWTIFDCSWLGSLLFESCGVFSLKEVGLLIYYQSTSPMDSVWTLMYYRYDLHTHQLFFFYFCVFNFCLAICCCISLNTMFTIEIPLTAVHF